MIVGMNDTLHVVVVLLPCFFLDEGFREGV